MQFDFFPETFFLMFLIIPVIFFLIVFVVMFKVCKSSQDVIGSISLEAPSFVIPASHRSQSDGAQIKTVRLPEKCPSCGAALSHEGIDWVGPLEARCTYCGGTVKARFENV